MLVHSGCDTSTDSQPRPLTILAAASAAEVISAVAAEFEQSTGVPVIVSAGPSNGLAQQVLSGAPADIFVSANRRWVAALSDEGMIVATADLFSNRMVLIVPENHPHASDSIANFSKRPNGRLAISGEHVPAGMYAEQILRSEEAYEGLLSQHRLVRGSDARVTARYVESGEVDAGIVYATDALHAADVRVVQTFDASDHDPITYSAALLNPPRTSDKRSARALFERLMTSDSTYETFKFQPLAK